MRNGKARGSDEKQGEGEARLSSFEQPPFALSAAAKAAESKRQHAGLTQRRERSAPPNASKPASTSNACDGSGTGCVGITIIAEK